MNDALKLFDTSEYTKHKIGFEYFFTISIIANILEEIKTRRNHIHKIIGLSNENLYSVPHISLFKIKSEREQDDLIVENAQQALQTISCFAITFTGPITFIHGEKKRSIVLVVENDEPIKEVFGLLHKEFSSRKRRITPHASIVKNISTTDFEKISPTLSKLNYKGEFLCKKITILKKVIGTERKENFKVLHEVKLQ